MNGSLRIFADRSEAGLLLAHQVQRQRLRSPVIVLGLPRGGVPVAYEIARTLKAPLDVWVVRKVGMPQQPEVAIGAIAPGDVLVHEPSIDDVAGWGRSFNHLVAEERRELHRRERVYRSGLPPLSLKGQTTVLVDDGLATGWTMLAAVRAARQALASHIVAAAPVASREAAELIRPEVDDIVVLQTPQMLFAVGQWYERFEQVEDAEVCRLLALSRRELSGSDTGRDRDREGGRVAARASPADEVRRTT